MTRQRLRSIHVRDFQSLADVRLEMGQFVVIVGHSNAGKSALIRALQAALFNWTGGSFVREGASAAQVDIVFEQPGPAGDSLSWWKPRKGGARYVVSDGAVETDISRVGKEMPPEIAELTGFRETECEGARSKIQVDAQFDAPFLLAGTGGQAARLLARVAKVDVLVTAQIRARRDMEAQRRRAADAGEQAAAFEQQLAAMPDYDGLLGELAGLDDRLHDLLMTDSLLGRAAPLIAERGVVITRATLAREAQLGKRLAAVKTSVLEAERLSRLVATVERYRAEAVSARRAAVAAGRKAKEAEKALNATLASLAICPVCGQKMGVRNG